MGNQKKHISFVKISYVTVTILLIAALFYNQILPPTINLIIKIAAVLLLIGLFLIKVKKFILITLSVLLALASGTLFYSQYAFDRLINQENKEIDVVTLVVLKDSPLASLSDLKDVKIGFADQMAAPLVTYITKKINEKASSFVSIHADDDLSNLDKLMNKSIDVMVLDNSLRDTLIEAVPDFETKTKVIATIQKVTIKDDTSIPVDTSNHPFIVLISGVDTRQAGAVADKARSDVNILMVINPLTRQVLTISIPRDTYTPLGCRGGAMDKLTHSGVYGIDCTVKTIENLFSIKINYYVKVNFTAFVNIVNVLGKINVYSKYAFTTTKYVSYSKHYTFKVGMNLMNAEQALFFSRERHAFTGSDVQRGLNQQEVIKGMINKVTEPATLLKIESLISVASKSVDTNFSVEAVMKLVQNQLSSSTAWTISPSALTGKADYQPTYSMGSRLLYVSWPDQTILKELQGRIKVIMTVIH